jgi:hypothetical protein
MLDNSNCWKAAACEYDVHDTETKGVVPLVSTVAVTNTHATEPSKELPATTNNASHEESLLDMVLKTLLTRTGLKSREMEMSNNPVVKGRPLTPVAIAVIVLKDSDHHSTIVGKIAKTGPPGEIKEPKRGSRVNRDPAVDTTHCSSTPEPAASTEPSLTGASKVATNDVVAKVLVQEGDEPTTHPENTLAVTLGSPEIPPPAEDVKTVPPHVNPMATTSGTETDTVTVDVKFVNTPAA